MKIVFRSEVMQLCYIGILAYTYYTAIYDKEKIYEYT